MNANSEKHKKAREEKCFFFGVSETKDFRINAKHIDCEQAQKKTKKTRGNLFQRSTRISPYAMKPLYTRYNN